VIRDSKTSPVMSMPHAEGDCSRALATSPLHLGGTGAPTGLVVALFRFGSSLRPPLFQGLPKIIHVAAADPAVPAWLSSAVQVLSAESVARGPGGTVVMSRLTDVIFVRALRTHMARTPDGEHGICALNDLHIGKALALMHERPGEPWTVESLATAVALSRSGFAAQFHALVGQPPLEYLARWRMTRAAQLLSESTLGVSEVAEQVGYRSDAAFQRAFKRLQGVAPRAFRRDRNAGPRP
jgi:AraC-like DNA-binding protein